MEMIHENENGLPCPVHGSPVSRMRERRPGWGLFRKLVILFTHDLHSYFLPQRLSSSSGPDRTEGGYAKLYTLIKGYQKRFKGQTLLVDGGDFSMGTLFHTAFMTDALELRLMAGWATMQRPWATTTSIFAWTAWPDPS
jgi:hypothetical protein